MTPSFLFFSNLTGAELTRLDVQQTVFLFAVSAFEDYGPHLPLGTKYFQAQKEAEALASLLKAQRPQWTFVIMPPAPLGIDPVDTRIQLSVRPHVLRDWLVDACASLAKNQFKYFLCISGSTSPRQLTAIEDAARMIEKGNFIRKKKRHFLSITSGLFTHHDLLKSPMWPKPQEKGGKKDTSLALFLSPETVKPSYKELPSIQKNPHTWNYLLDRILNRPMGYWGAPNEATAAEGERVFNDQANSTAEKLLTFLDHQNGKKWFISSFGWNPLNRSTFKAYALALAFFFMMLIWSLFSLRSLFN